jgi:holliday junction DNA helicase RuvB
MAHDELRPTTWSEYVGQHELKRKLSIHINAAKQAARMPEHILLCAGPGYGKTSIAQIIAAELNENLEMVTMPVTTSALAAIVRTFEGVLLLDEIHRASPKQQEDLLPLLEFGYVQTPGYKRIEAGDLTIIGATTEEDKLIEPLLDRFSIKPSYAEYTDDEMAIILTGMCDKVDIDISDEMARALAPAAAGSPRRCRQFALALRDLADSGYAPEPSTQQVLDLCGVAFDGLSDAHIRYMETLAALGGAKGLQVLCSLLRQNQHTVMNLERDLLKRGLLQIEGCRELTRAGFNRLKDQASCPV